jgi:hypothetical protein
VHSLCTKPGTLHVCGVGVYPNTTQRREGNNLVASGMAADEIADLQVIGRRVEQCISALEAYPNLW